MRLAKHPRLELGVVSLEEERRVVKDEVMERGISSSQVVALLNRLMFLEDKVREMEDIMNDVDWDTGEHELLP